MIYVIFALIFSQLATLAGFFYFASLVSKERGDLLNRIMATDFGAYQAHKLSERPKPAKEKKEFEEQEEAFKKEVEKVGTII